MSNINFDKTYSLNKSFYFSTKGESLQIVNIVEDDNFFLKIDGACKTVFEMIVNKKKPSEVLTFLMAQPSPEPKDKTEEFIQTYIADLIEMGILEG